MKLTKRNIGELFYVDGGDGSYMLRLCDTKNGLHLFYSYSTEGHYMVEKATYKDYRRYDKKLWNKAWDERGWANPKYGKELL